MYKILMLHLLKIISFKFIMIIYMAILTLLNIFKNSKYL